MNQRLDALLVAKHPNLFAARFANMRETAMCWGFECGNGWYRLIKEAADKLEAIITVQKVKDPEGWTNGFYRASQVKEKYGTLRFYLSGGTDDMYAVVNKAERLSSVTCETCGKPGKLRGHSWVYTACAKHTRKS